MNKKQFRKGFAEAFSIQEMRDIAFDLNMDDEKFDLANKENFARELIKACIRTGKTDDLIEMCKDERPGLEWLTPNENKKGFEQKSSSMGKLLSALSAYNMSAGGSTIPVRGSLEILNTLLEGVDVVSKGSPELQEKMLQILDGDNDEERRGLLTMLSAHIFTLLQVEQFKREI